MSMIDALFGSGFGAIGDQRALSEKEIMDMQIEHWRRAVNAKSFDPGLLQNYRPPVHVPQGWVDWYTMGDEAV